MHQRFKLCAAATGVALLLALPGCGGQGETGGTQATETADPTHIYEEVQDNLLIDAEVKGPPEGVVPKVYAGEIKTFTPEEIDAFLAWNDDAIAEVTDDYSDDFGHTYVASCQSGARFTTSAYLTSTLPGGLGYTKVEDMKRYIAYPISRVQEDYEEYGHRPGWRVTNLFEEPVELPFATAQKAEEQVRDALSTLGLEELILNRTLYLSHDRLEEAGRILQGEEWAHTAKGGEDATYPQWDDWSEEHDCYLFEFFGSVDHIPMNYHSIDTATSFTMSNDIIVYYTSRGIIGLYVYGPWNVCETVEAPERILSATEAVEKARERLENTISSAQRTVDRVALVYVYEQDGDGWLLRPIWEISVRQPVADSDGVEYTFIRIDAVTGAEF